MARRAIGSGERDRRERLVARWRRSGQSATEFGRRHGLSQWALYSWAKHVGARPNCRRPQQRRVRRSTTAGAAAFIPARLVSDEPAGVPTRTEGVVEIQLRGGDVIRVVGEVGADRLRAVVKAVREAC